MRWPRSWAAGVLALLVAVLLGSAAVLAGPFATIPAASAAEPESFVRVRLQGLKPALPLRAGSLTLTAEVTNTSELELSGVHVYFWRSLDPITDGEGMAAAVDSAANEPLGGRKGVPLDLPSSTDRTLAPGQQTRFTLTVKLASLELPSTNGIYLMGAQVRGRTDVAGPLLTLGRVRVFIPVVAQPPPVPVQFTSLVLLTSRPSLLREDLLVDDHLAAEVAEGGRLRTLLAAADTPEASFAVDPALIQALTSMADGYRIRGPDGRDVAGVGAADAGRWLADFARLRSRDGYRLLYGSPDATALVHAGQEAVLAQAAAASRSVPQTRSLPLLAFPASGRADRATVAALAELNPAAVLLSEDTVRATGPLLEGPNGVPVVRYGTAASAGGPGPDPRTTASHRRQRLLADTWLASVAADGQEPAAQVRVIGSVAQARSREAAMSAPWLRRATLTALLTQPPAEEPVRYRYPGSVRERELDPQQLQAVAELATSTASYADLLVSPAQAQLDGDAAVARAASTSFRRSAKAGRGFVAAQQAELDQILRGDLLTVTVPQRVTTSARSGVFPVTVQNRLPADESDPDRNLIHGRVVFTSNTPQRLSVAPVEVRRLRAGEKVSENARVEARANGIVRITAQLHTASGEKVGKPETFDVRATQAGTTGWFIALAAGLVLVGTTALRIRTVTRERARADTETSAPPDPGPLSSAPPTDDPAGADPAALDGPAVADPAGPAGSGTTKSGTTQSWTMPPDGGGRG